MECLFLRWIAGLFISLVAGHFVTNKLNLKLRKDYNFPEKYNKLSGFLGCLERLAYTISIINGWPIFVGIWLGVKMVGRWSPEGNIAELFVPSEKGKQLAPIAINIFLIGNLVSLLFAVLGAFIIGF